MTFLTIIVMIIISNESKNKHGDNDDDGNDNYEFHNEICFLLFRFLFSVTFNE